MASTHFVVGLTGGIASGKTTASDIFAELGVQVVDTDVLAHQLMLPEMPGHSAIVEHFGVEVVQPNGLIDRSRLRQELVDVEQLYWLEQLMHPLIRCTAESVIAPELGGYSILVVPLLFETGFDQLVNTTLVIDIDEITQCQRARQRLGMTDSQLSLLLARQWTRQQRLERADSVIDGTASISAFRQNIVQHHARYTETVKGEQWQ